MIRAWAVWERDRRLSIGLPIFFVSVWSALCVCAARYLRSLKCKHRDLIPILVSLKPSTWQLYKYQIQRFLVALFPDAAPFSSWNGPWWWDLKEVCCSLRLLSCKTLAEPQPGILILMCIKGYQTREYLLDKIYAPNIERSHVVKMGPSSGLVRLVYVDGTHMFCLSE